MDYGRQISFLPAEVLSVLWKGALGRVGFSSLTYIKSKYREQLRAVEQGQRVCLSSLAAQGDRPMLSIFETGVPRYFGYF